MSNTDRAAYLDRMSILNFLGKQASEAETALQQLENEYSKLLADWELEEKVLSHLASIPTEGDENIYVRYMQALINCNKRFPTELRQLGKSIKRSKKQLDALKDRIGRIRKIQVQEFENLGLL